MVRMRECFFRIKSDGGMKRETEGGREGGIEGREGWKEVVHNLF